MKESDTWAFQPERDAFSPDALLDLRGLNEEVAGQHGFIRLSEDGNDFVRGDGQPIRFWGGSTYTQRLAHEKKDQTVLEHHARFLAKRGVNVVRLHGAIQPKKEDSQLTDVDEKELDEIYRLVAAMKKAGIYTIISPYWGVQARAQKAWGVADPGDGNCTALLFFDPALQKGYKAWLKRIYADVNPYTGVPLAKDPAVAIIQIQNEDSMLFWTMQGVKGQALLNLRKLYGDWVLKKYGSFDKAQEAWQALSARDGRFRRRPAGNVHRLGIHAGRAKQERRRRRPRDPAGRPGRVHGPRHVRLQQGDRPLPARRPGLQTPHQRRQLAHRRPGHPRRRRALELHGQRRGGKEPLLLRPAQRAEHRLADPARPGLHLAIVHEGAERLAAVPAAGRRPPVHRARKPLGAAHSRTSPRARWWSPRRAA